MRYLIGLFLLIAVGMSFIVKADPPPPQDDPCCTGGAESNAGANSQSIAQSQGGGGFGASSAGFNIDRIGSNISFDNHSKGSDLSERVPNVFAPGLTAIPGTCLGSARPSRRPLAEQRLYVSSESLQSL